MIEPYKELIHGGDAASLDMRNPGAGIIDFSVNTNPHGMPQSVRQAVTEGIEANHHYPDNRCRTLRAALSDFEEVPPDWILCGAGAADLIFRLAFGLRPKQALLFSPTFAEYELALNQIGCRCVFHRLEEKRGFAPASGLVGQIEGCDLVFLCNPNNPTGVLAKPRLMAEVLEACKKAGAILAVDECFLDFLPQPQPYTMKKYLAGSDNLIVLRAFTKTFAMPGLRLGYALSSNPALLRKMDEAGPAWNVSVPAQLAGIAAAGERDYLKACRENILRGRLWLEEELAACGLRVYRGTVNYILFYTPCAALAQRLAERGIIIRDASNYRGLSPGYFRVAVRTKEENHALIEAIKECLD